MNKLIMLNSITTVGIRRKTLTILVKVTSKKETLFFFKVDV